MFSLDALLGSTERVDQKKDVDEDGQRSNDDDHAKQEYDIVDRDPGEEVKDGDDKHYTTNIRLEF